jgi:hypothetical protein
MFCHETVAIENSFLGSLQVINSYRIVGHELHLLQNDALIARFRLAN